MRDFAQANQFYTIRHSNRGRANLKKRKHNEAFGLAPPAEMKRG
jgi:hypothetical protein